MDQGAPRDLTMHGSIFPAACILCFVMMALPARGQIRVVEQLSITGEVESVQAAVVTVRGADQQRLQVRVQSPEDKSVPLADGRLLTFPCECRVGGVVETRKVTPGQVVRFRVRLNGAGKTSGDVEELTLVDARDAAIGATWQTPPPDDPATFVECEIVALVKTLSKTRLAVSLPAGKPFKKPTVVAASLADDLTIRLSSNDPRTISPGARVVGLEAVKLDSGDLVARKIVVENAGNATVRAGGDELLRRRFAKLSDEPKAAAREVRSKHFAFLTDVSDREWAIIEFKLERMVGLLEAYFGRRQQGIVEGFIVRDLAAFPGGSLTEAMGVEKIRRGEGVCFNLTLGPQRRALLYSCVDHGVIQHECTHGFCHMTFGSTGPTWLAEGVAEMGNYWKEGELAVDLPGIVIGYLQRAPRRQLLEIAVPGRTDAGTWQDYAWRWALCHLLATSPNYAGRFKPLAIQLMEKQPGVSFESVFGPVAKEISFEYDQFLRTVGNGYRSDLAAWPWKAAFRSLRQGGKAELRVLARQGWQASGVEVREGETYDVVAEGTWRTGTAARPIDAKGDADGHGRLVAAVLTSDDRGFALTDELPLGTNTSFRAPASGRLHVRCKDEWTQLADNDGHITVTVFRP